MSNIANLIKNRRIEKNLTIDQISVELKISTSLIKKFENVESNDDYNIVFYLGHLRSYLRLLDLNDSEIISEFKKEISFNDKAIYENIQKPLVNKQIISYQKIFSASLILFIFTSFYYLFVREGNSNTEYALVPDLPESLVPVIEKSNLYTTESSNIDNKPTEEEENIISSSSVIASTENISDIENTVTLKILNPTWVQLRDKSNNIILSKLMEKDEEFSYKLELFYNITAGNAGNILVIINNNVKGKIGKYGEVLDSYILDKNFIN